MEGPAVPLSIEDFFQRRPRAVTVYGGPKSNQGHDLDVIAVPEVDVSNLPVVITWGHFPVLS